MKLTSGTKHSLGLLELPNNRRMFNFVMVGDIIDVYIRSLKKNFR